MEVYTTFLRVMIKDDSDLPTCMHLDKLSLTTYFHFYCTASTLAMDCFLPGIRSPASPLAKTVELSRIQAS